ncbi:MAG: hypothetical protein GQ574_23195 [Crocinitomix sp.]|nr:hypothetical protein [Crocinitomix sp.]
MSQSLVMEKSAQTEHTTAVSNKMSFEYLERNRYGVMVALMLIVGCSAGIAVGVGALTQVLSLSLLALTTMAALSMMLALAPIKTIVYTSAIAIITDIIIILVNLIM